MIPVSLKALVLHSKACQIPETSRMLTSRVVQISLQLMDLHGIAMSDQNLASVAAWFPRLAYVDLSFCKVKGSISVPAYCRMLYRTYQI